MAVYRILESHRLSGEAEISTSKNAVLPILAAGLLTSDALTVRRVPKLTDVETMLGILRGCGAKITREGSDCVIQTAAPASPPREGEMRRIRASILVMGPILARTGSVTVSLPGGCAIGQRPIDLHVKGLQALGAQAAQMGGELTLTGRLRGANVYLDVPSVGATENLLMAATLAEGVTRIENAAKEPEIVDLAACLTRMGARIRGAGSGTMVVEGVARLHGAEHQPIPDRIEAATLACAAAVTQGSVLLKGAQADHMRAVLFKLSETGVALRETKAGIRVSGVACQPLEVRTLAYPGFPTDVQAPMMVVAILTKGTSVFLETIFENRYMHVPELARLGAHIRVENRVAIIEGGSPLTGAPVTGTDLRAGAALMIAGLIAQGGTTLADPDGHIDRGYDALHEKLASLGARVQRVAP